MQFCLYALIPPPKRKHTYQTYAVLMKKKTGQIFFSRKPVQSFPLSAKKKKKKKTRQHSKAKQIICLAANQNKNK